jgi:hypothetical protein
MGGLNTASAGLGATAIATVVLSAITLALVIATVALVIATRSGTKRVREDAREELRILRRQLDAAHRPLLIDVPLAAPMPEGTGAEVGADQDANPDRGLRYARPTVETKLPGIEPQRIEPSSVFVALEGGKIYLTLPLRNVGRGVAAIDGSGVALTGPLIGDVEYRAVQQERVPVGETTRIDLVAVHLERPASEPAAERVSMRGLAWHVAVPYRDFAGEQRTVAQLEIVCRGGDVAGPWVIERVEQDSPGEREPQRDELPDASPPERTRPGRQRFDVRREPVVDLWGNPIKPRRRSR